MPPTFLFANSFDRSGSSMFAKVLAKHPDIECLFQPLNSSVFRSEIFNYWEHGIEHREGKKLIENIIHGNLGMEVIKSHWFFTHSTTFQIEENKTYLIKTTNAHLKIGWLKVAFPEFGFLCLFRKPQDILCSLVRNGLHTEWYSREMAFECLEGFTVINNRTLALGNYIKQQMGKDHIIDTACIISMMNYVMKKDSEQDECIYFENIIRDPDNELNAVVAKYGLGKFSFSKYMNTDHNIIGKPWKDDHSWRGVLEDKTYVKVMGIFKKFDLLY